MSPEILLVAAAPLILASLGGLLSEWSGRLNIGLEGFMLLGAFLGIAGSRLAGDWAGSLGAGLALALLGGGLGGALMAWAAIRHSANIYIVGMAVNLLAGSLVSFLGSWIWGSRSVVSLAAAQRPPAGLVAWLSLLLALAACAGLWWFSRHSRNGLRLRVLGSEADMLLARGIDIERLGSLALMASSTLASLAGAFLSLRLESFVPNQSAGLGWIALVLVFIGRRHPAGIALAALAFVALERWSLAAQAGNAHPALLVGLPYLLIFAGLVVVSLARRLGELAAHRRRP